jgi:excinuclease ABC subunit C
MLMQNNLAEKIKTKAPQAPGIYIFKNKIGQVLYIGKAINLKKRLNYYTRKKVDLFPKTAQFIKLAKKLEWIEVESDLQALLLEMNLIRTLKPKYNALNRDDKRPLYIWITNDEFPRVKTARIEIANTGDYFGPFPSGYKLKQIMKKLRQIFPYCSCNQRRKKPCMFADLGLCPMKTDSQGSMSCNKAEYKKNIRRLKLFLNGKVAQVLKLLNKEMKQYSLTRKYELAQKSKVQIETINQLLTQNHKISDYLRNEALSHNLALSQLKSLQTFLNLPKLFRIEGYDIANISGKLTTASMVVFEHGFANSGKYRHFKIQDIKDANDPLMIYQTINRRLKHKNWGMPDLILVDGGITQVRAGQKAINENGLNIKVIGLSKRLEQIIIPNLKSYQKFSPPLDSPYLTLLRAVRDESHRFATNYHKKLRDKEMLK